MREINNNIGKFQTNDKRIEKTDKTEIEQKVEVTEKEVIKDFSDPKAEALGRSQVKLNNADNLKSDLAFLAANPKAVKSAENFFNVAYEQLLQKDVPNAYEKAAAIATIYAKEITTK